MSQIASQKPLRAARRLIKTAGSTPSRDNGLRQATCRGNRDPRQSGRLHESRIGSVSTWLVVRAASSGRWFNAFACLPIQPVHGAGANPKATGSGIRRIGPKGINGIGVPILAGLFVRSPWRAPVRQTAPRAGPVVLVWREGGRVFEVPLSPHASTHYDVFMNSPWFDVQRFASRHGLADQQTQSLSATHHLALLFEAVLVFGFRFFTTPKNAWRQTVPACATPDTPRDLSWLPGLRAPCVCRAYVPAAAATLSPARNSAASGMPLR
jgi:hypothetical protein